MRAWHMYSGLWFSALRKFAPVLTFGYLAGCGTIGFSSLVSVNILSHDEHIYCSSCTEFATCCKHYDTTKFVKS